MAILARPIRRSRGAFALAHAIGFVGANMVVGAFAYCALEGIGGRALPLLPALLPLVTGLALLTFAAWMLQRDASAR